ncbi:MAG: hypothetical protein NTV22_05895 [bacterium]|nr:hypothetical protein [bacterium]
MLARKQGAWALLFCAREFGEQDSLGTFVHHLLDLAAADLPIQPKQPKGIRKKLDGAGATALGFGLQFHWHTEGKQKDPQLLLRDELVRLHDYAQAHGAQALVLMIDDVQNLPRAGQELTLLRNVLTDQQLLAKCKLLVILSSLEKAWQPFLLRDHPVGRLFMPRRCLGLLTKTETLSLINESLKDTEVVFDDAVKHHLYDYSRGHVFEIQALCEALFDQQIKGVVTMKHWPTALRQTLFSLADAQFAGMLDQASPQELAVLRIMVNANGVLGPADIEERLSDVKNAAEVLKRLTAKGLVQRVGRGQFLVPDVLFAEYVRSSVAP